MNDHDQPGGIKLTDKKPLKSERCANPISPLIFCADPTAVEYEGRLYVYGTNDHQQYEAVGDEGKNTYERIKSLVVFSTADMVNWEYHGLIDTAAVAPWIKSSWAPSVCSRREADGREHFYLYFSNSGCGVGVITATHPLGPWSDPLGRPLIDQGMPELGDCPNPFDPGVCIDDNGVGWLAFGGGIAKDGTDCMPGSSRIVRLGEDMLSLGCEAAPTPAPYFFEASELNFIGGQFLYTYNNNWLERAEWPYEGFERPNLCSMAYLTSKTPLDPSSWVYRGHYFLNAGDSGMEACNNHTHIVRFAGQYFILHHTMLRQEAMGTTHGGFRSLCADRLELDESTLSITPTKGTREGLEQVGAVDPYAPNAGALLFTCAGLDYCGGERHACAVKTPEKGAWLYVKGVDFTSGAAAVLASVKGEGRIELRLDDPSAAACAVIASHSGEWQSRSAELSCTVTGKHDLYLVFSDEGVCLDEWRFLPAGQRL